MPWKCLYQLQVHLPATAHAHLPLILFSCSKMVESEKVQMLFQGARTTLFQVGISSLLEACTDGSKPVHIKADLKSQMLTDLQVNSYYTTSDWLWPRYIQSTFSELIHLLFLLMMSEMLNIPFFTTDFGCSTT